MDLEKALDVPQWRPAADRVLGWVKKKQSRTLDLIELTEFGNDRVSQRAAVAISDLGRLEPDWLLPYVRRLIRLIREERNNTIPRGLLRYFSELPIDKITDEEVEGQLVEMAFNYLESPTQPVTFRVFSMQILYNFCARYPELKVELKEQIEAGMEEGGPGFRSRGRKLLRNLA